jgi:hypothetical protein
MWDSLWREDGSVVYNCSWSSSKHSVSWPYFTVSDSRLPFSSPPTTRRVTVEVFDPTSTREWPTFLSLHIEYWYDADRIKNTEVCVCCHGNVFTEPLHSNGRFFWLHYSGYQVSYYTAFKCEWEVCTTPRGISRKYGHESPGPGRPVAVYPTDRTENLLKETHRLQCDLTSLFLFFQNKEIRLQLNITDCRNKAPFDPTDQ